MNNPRRGMTLIVKTVARLTTGLILLFAVYSIINEQMRPGGGFPGGIIFALALILLLLSFGKAGVLEKLPEEINRFVEGAIAIISSALILLAGSYFLFNLIYPANPHRPFSLGIVPFCNFAIAINVGLGLFTVFSAMVLFKSKINDLKDKDKN
ncbi:MAG: hypothetical protein LHV68_03210 [Elusimicrobia bacterium]|nr:hypothetical protein [Candidatus Liberimonas magnetica]